MHDKPGSVSLWGNRKRLESMVVAMARVWTEKET
jgi:hypothetical protein